VTTGNVSGRAAKAEKNAAISSIVQKVVQAAYGAFSHGLDLSLMAAAALMLFGAVVAAFTMPGRTLGTSLFGTDTDVQTYEDSK
jgi:hypothetical protein